MTATAWITADESLAALERLLASARKEVVLSFHLLDARTALRDDTLRARGLETWADLIADASARGVRLRILLADFDPLFASRLHRAAWASASVFADVVRGDTQILCAPHGQRAGRLWQIIWRARIRAALDRLRNEDPATLTPVQRQALQDGPVLRPVRHHQSFAIADGKAVVIGGFGTGEERFDAEDQDRPYPQTRHALSVALEDRDFAGALLAHFADCWNAALDAGIQSLTDAAAAIPVANRLQSRPDLRLLRTLSVPRAGFARLAPASRVTDHQDTLLRLFHQAQSSVYIETQTLRHAPLVNALAEAAKRNPRLQLIVLLPAAPEPGPFDGDDGWDARRANDLQTACLTRLSAAFGNRLAVVTPAQDSPGAETPPHADLPSSVVLVDGERAMIGSANLNARSLRWNGEASILVSDRRFTDDLMQRLSARWLGTEPGVAQWDAEIWNRVAREQAALPADHRRALVRPYPVPGAKSPPRRLFAMPDDMV